MERLVNTAKLYTTRAILVIGVLMPLCLSNNTGVCFLPFPPLPASQPQAAQVTDGSPAPLLTNVIEGRVEMVKTLEKRDGAEHQTSHVAAHSFKRIFDLPASAGRRARSVYLSLFPSSTFALRADGRAPPHLL